MLRLSKLRPRGVNIRVRRISDRIEGSHTVAIPRVASKSGVAEGGDIRANLSNLDEAAAVIALTTLNFKAGLIIGVVGPTQIDLTAGYSRCG